MKKIYERYIKKPVEEDLKSTMVFISGPRQTGKTTFALNFLPEPSEKHPAYLNWDNLGARTSLLKGELPANQKCIIFVTTGLIPCHFHRSGILPLPFSSFSSIEIFGYRHKAGQFVISTCYHTSFI